MKVLFENKNQTVFLYEEKWRFEGHFNRKSAEILGEVYQYEVGLFRDNIHANQMVNEKHNKLIINTLAVGATVGSNVQDWIPSTFYPKIWKDGIQHKANPNSRSKLSFFPSLVEGRAWLSKL